MRPPLNGGRGRSNRDQVSTVVIIGLYKGVFRRSELGKVVFDGGDVVVNQLAQHTKLEVQVGEFSRSAP
mgnify:CR=1 FL=1